MKNVLLIVIAGLALSQTDPAYTDFCGSYICNNQI